MSKAASPAQLQNALTNLQRAMQAVYQDALRTRQKVGVLEARAALQDAGRKPRLPLEFRSQFGEDLLLWTLFDGQLDGFFIEVGAFDGYSFSVTYALEAVGWNGLLVEAIPDRHRQCAERRPHSRVVHAALSRRGSSGTAEFVVSSDEHGGMFSYLKASQEHKQSLDKAKISQAKVQVPLTTLDELLKGHDGPIDAAVIDVEGGEIDLLDGFDLHRHKPKVLLVEDNTYGRDPAVGNYMGAMPYVFAGWLEVNRVYIRADLTELQRRMRAV